MMAVTNSAVSECVVTQKPEPTSPTTMFSFGIMMKKKMNAMVARTMAAAIRVAPIAKRSLCVRMVVMTIVAIGKSITKPWSWKIDW